MSALIHHAFNARKDLPAQLLARNQEVAAKTEKGEPVTAPGVPPGFPEPEEQVTDDCIPSPGGRVCSASSLDNKAP